MWLSSTIQLITATTYPCHLFIVAVDLKTTFSLLPAERLILSALPVKMVRVSVLVSIPTFYIHGQSLTLHAE
jgi:hypothetical protein